MAENEIKLAFGSCDTEEALKNLLAEMTGGFSNEISERENKLENLELSYREVELSLSSINPNLSANERNQQRTKLMGRKIELKKQIEAHKETIKQRQLQTSKIKEKLEKNKSLVTLFYNLREAAKNDPQDKDKKISIKFNDKGEAFLSVEKQEEKSEEKQKKDTVERQMESAFNINFSIHDGKVILGNMSPEQMKEAIDFLSRRGLKYELPPATDRELREFKDECDAKAKEATEEPKIPADEELEGVSPELADKPAEQWTEEERKQVEAAAAANTSTGNATAQPAGTDKSNEKTFKDARDDFISWAKDRLGKERGLGFDISWGGFGNTFSFYQDNSQDWAKDDGKEDKKGKRKEDGLLFRVKLHKGKDGKLSGIDYYVPKNGKIPDNLAGKMAAMVKAQGALFMNFPENIPETDPGVFRKACAQNGVIPTGKNFNFNENQARNMIKEAEGSLNSDAVLKYKGQMGEYLLKRERAKGEGKGNASIMAYARSLIDEQKLESLKNCFETYIMPEIDQLGGDAKAEDIIGASDASNKLFEIFTSDRQKPVGEALNNLGFTPEVLNKLNLSAEQKEKLNDISLTQTNDLKADQLEVVYDIMKIKYTKDAKKKLDDRAAHKNEDAIVTYVDKEVDSASKKLQNLGRKFSRKGVQSVGFPEFSTGRYEKPTVGGSHSAMLAAARQKLAEKAY